METTMMVRHKRIVLVFFQEIVFGKDWRILAIQKDGNYFLPSSQSRGIETKEKTLEDGIFQLTGMKRVGFSSFRGMEQDFNISYLAFSAENMLSVNEKRLGIDRDGKHVESMLVGIEYFLSKISPASLPHVQGGFDEMRCYNKSFREFSERNREGLKKYLTF